MDKNELKTIADKLGLSDAVLLLELDVLNIEIPITEELETTVVEELNLSARSRNGLMRSKLDTVGKVAEKIMTDGSIESVRNLGKKSSYEIKCALLDAAYESLDEENKNRVIERLVEINDGL